MLKKTNRYERERTLKKKVKELIDTTCEIDIINYSCIDSIILDNCPIFDNMLSITYNQVKDLITLYSLDIKKSINTKKRSYNYNKIYVIYNEEDKNDKIFNRKLKEIITKSGSGILPKLVSHIHNDGSR